jgi:hypothetical protein
MGVYIKEDGLTELGRSKQAWDASFQRSKVNQDFGQDLIHKTKGNRNAEKARSIWKVL